MGLKELLEAAAHEAFCQILADGCLPMDVLLVRVRLALQSRYENPVPFEMVDAGLRLAFDEGRLRLKDGMVGKPPLPIPPWHANGP